MKKMFKTLNQNFIKEDIPMTNVHISYQGNTIKPQLGKTTCHKN